MMTYKFYEYESREIAYHLTERDKEYLFELRSHYPTAFTFHSLRDGTFFEFKSFIGVIELEKVSIIIVPKFNHGFQDVVGMLLFIERIPATMERQSQAEFCKHSLVELLVRLFVKETETILRLGLFKEYVNEEENLNILRGRIHVREHMKTNILQSGKIYCAYDELQTNVMENQVILSTLEVAQKFHLSPSLMKRVNRLYHEFVRLTNSFTEQEWPSFHYNRLNQHYEPAHKLAFYIWKQLYINNIYESRKTSHFSFLLDMNNLFERFTAVLLDRYLPQKYRVKSQNVFKKAIMQNGSSYRVIRPDVIVEQPTATPIIIDTKYKNYGKNKISNTDIYQLTFYANFLWKSDEYFQTVIIYPRYAGDDPVNEVIQILPHTQNEGKLFVKSISIENVLKAVKDRNLKYLKQVSLELI